MQFHLNGFRTGDPRVSAAPTTQTSVSHVRSASRDVPEVDVLIVGSGPAGLTLAAQLAAFPDITTMIVEQKAGPLALGQADGIACRTMEMFHALGISGKVLEEAYWVNEISFWRPDGAHPERITRSGRSDDTEEGLSEFPHVILNQARVHDFYLEAMRNSPARLQPLYNRRFIDLDTGASDGQTQAPVTVRLAVTDEDGVEQVETVRARFVVGCDGARSGVRKALQLELKGDSANQAWGVMDVLAVTDFPDIRLKAAIHSATEGSMLVIPREGGYLVRLYIELDKLNPDERVAQRSITIERLIAAAQRILHPYTLTVHEVAWWSIYEIGQRLCDRFDNVPADAPDTQLPSVFIAGDACHTHSPKAGQGMNVSMQDSFNLGWKLAAVLRGQADPRLLHSYSAERQTIARVLIDFDRELAAMFSARPKTTSDSEGVDPAAFQSYLLKQGRFTAGTATQYAPSIITGDAKHQQLAEGFAIGTRFHSAPVVRLADAKPVHLGHSFRADGRWRLYLFDGNESGPPSPTLAALCDHLASSPTSPVLAYTPSGADLDSVIDIRAVFQQRHRDVELAGMPALLMPQKGIYGLHDYEKMFCIDERKDIYDQRRINRAEGCIVIVRPDQYIANVLPLNAYEALASFFSGFMLPETAGVLAQQSTVAVAL